MVHGRRARAGDPPGASPRVTPSGSPGQPSSGWPTCAAASAATWCRSPGRPGRRRGRRPGPADRRRWPRRTPRVLGAGDRVELRCEDVADTDLAGVDGVFVDPARRGGGRRALDPRSWSPPFSFVLDVAARVPATGAKLAPGVPHGVLPPDAEAEWVSDGGDVVECALWCGPLATGVRRRATLLPSGATLTGDGTRRGVVGPVGRYLVEPDGAVIRAGLVAEAADLVDGRLLDPTIAYLTCDAPALDTVRHGVRDHRRAAVRPQAAAHPAARARGRAADREEARHGRPARGVARAAAAARRRRGDRSC